VDVMGQNAEKSRCVVCHINFVNSGKVLVADGKNFHPQCFKCVTCKLPIKGRWHHKGKNYECQECTMGEDGIGETMRKFLGEEKQKLFPKCSGCGKNIEGQVLTSNDPQLKGRKYHPECFNCLECKKNLGKGQPYGSDGKGIYCTDCIQKLQGK